MCAWSLGKWAWRYGRSPHGEAARWEKNQSCRKEIVRWGAVGRVFTMRCKVRECSTWRAASASGSCEGQIRRSRCGQSNGSRLSLRSVHPLLTHRIQISFSSSPTRCRKKSPLCAQSWRKSPRRTAMPSRRRILPIRLSDKSAANRGESPVRRRSVFDVAAPLRLLHFKIPHSPSSARPASPCAHFP